jgi:hypothetical protein
MTTLEELQQSLFEITQEVIPDVKQMTDGNLSARSENTLCQIIIGNREEFTVVDFPSSMTINGAWIFISFLVFSEEKMSNKDIENYFEFCSTHNGPISYWKLERIEKGLELWLQCSIPAGVGDTNLFLELLYENHALAEINSKQFQEQFGYSKPVDKFEYIYKPARPLPNK